jgi:hypothetical protein
LNPDGTGILQLHDLPKTNIDWEWNVLKTAILNTRRAIIMQCTQFDIKTELKMMPTGLTHSSPSIYKRRKHSLPENEVKTIQHKVQNWLISL